MADYVTSWRDKNRESLIYIEKDNRFWCLMLVPSPCPKIVSRSNHWFVSLSSFVFFSKWFWCLKFNCICRWKNWCFCLIGFSFTGWFSLSPKVHQRCGVFILVFLHHSLNPMRHCHTPSCPSLDQASSEVQHRPGQVVSTPSVVTCTSAGNPVPWCIFLIYMSSSLRPRVTTPAAELDPKK